MIDGGVPVFADQCGLGDRYRYWIGQSGRRHLFTAVNAAELANFSQSVVVLARREGEGYAAIAVIEGCGPVGSDDRDLTAFVHLLAATPAERSALMADLTGDQERLAA